MVVRVYNNDCESCFTLMYFCCQIESINNSKSKPKKYKNWVFSPKKLSTIEMKTKQKKRSSTAPEVTIFQDFMFFQKNTSRGFPNKKQFLVPSSPEDPKWVP